MKAVIASHLLHFEGLRRQRFLFDSLILELLRWDVIQREHFFQLVPIFWISYLFICIVRVRAIDRPRMRELRCGSLAPVIEKILLLCEYAIHIGRIVLMFLLLLVKREIPRKRCQGPGRFPSRPILRELVYNM